MIKKLIKLCETNFIPDSIIRFGIRQLLKKRLGSLVSHDVEFNNNKKMAFISEMNSSPVALVPELANEQHYEVPSKFYDFCLGKQKKYSSCYCTDKTRNLNQSENESLKLTANHAHLKDGQSILELGCGWGSLTLWMASKYPKSKITAVSNSKSQKVYILSEAKKRKLRNIKVITADMNEFSIKDKFDRVVSVEMIEHMRNHKKLFKSIASWLKPKGMFFMHIFVHQSQPYLFEVEGDDDWMSQYFFSGGMMPSKDLPLYFQDQMKLLSQWDWSGTHYEKTANAWLENLDKNKTRVLPILKETYGEKDGEMWLQRWRIFFMACAELWGYKKGVEWRVGHYLFQK